MPEAKIDTAPSFTPDSPAADLPRAESPTRLLLLALAWILAAGLGAFLASFIVSFVVGFHDALALKHHRPAWIFNPVIPVLISVMAIDLVFLLAAWRRAKIVGWGDRIEGLEIGPVTRPVVLIGLAAASLVVVYSWPDMVGHWLGHPPLRITQVFDLVLASGRTLQTAAAMAALVLAPISEELFFRGWLWTGLRRHWSPFPVMIATALPWMLIHMADDLTRPLFLFPGAILLSCARHFCGGVRASILLHMTNNLMAIGLPGLIIWLGHG